MGTNFGLVFVSSYVFADFVARNRLHDKESETTSFREGIRGSKSSIMPKKGDKF